MHRDDDFPPGFMLPKPNTYVNPEETVAVFNPVFDNEDEDLEKEYEQFASSQNKATKLLGPNLPSNDRPAFLNSSGVEAGEEQLTKLTKPNIAFFVLGLFAFVCFVFVLVAWFGGRIIYAFGGAWFALLSFFAFVATMSNIDRKTSALLSFKRHNITTLIISFLSLFCCLVAFVCVLIEPPTNGLDKYFKPLFCFFSILSITSFLFFSLAVPKSKITFQNIALQTDEQLEKFTSETTPKAKFFSGCKECLLVTLFALFIFATASVVYQTTLKDNYLLSDDETQVLIKFYTNYSFPTDSLFQLDDKWLPENIEEEEETQREMFFRCQGSGSTRLLLFHGLRGQSLDFSWLFKKLSLTQFTVCSFDRPGYANSYHFGPNPRTSLQLAFELKSALDKVGITQSSNLIFVGHSFAGFNMRVFNALFPNYAKGILFIDALNPIYFDDCKNEELKPDITYYLGERVMDSGLPLFFFYLGAFDSIAEISSLPSDVQDEYGFHILKSEWFTTALLETKSLGYDCFFMSENSDLFVDLPIPVRSVVAEKGLYGKDSFKALELGEISALNENRTEAEFERVIEGATHSGILFVEEFAQQVIQEVLLLVQEVEAN